MFWLNFAVILVFKRCTHIFTQMYFAYICTSKCYVYTLIHSTYIKPILSNRFYIKWQSGMMIISKRFPFCLPKCFYNDKHWVALVNIWNSISCTQWFDFCQKNGYRSMFIMFIFNNRMFMFLRPCYPSDAIYILTIFILNFL